MNYNALKCAMHNNEYEKFRKILYSFPQFTIEQDEIFLHACFFSKTKYAKALINSGRLFNNVICQRAIPVCLKKQDYKTLNMILNYLNLVHPNSLSKSSRMWNMTLLQIINFYGMEDKFGFYSAFNDVNITNKDRQDNLEYCYHTFIKYMDENVKIFFIDDFFKYIQHLIKKLLLFMNKKDTNNYLLMEIIYTDPIVREFTYHDIFMMISDKTNN